MYFNFTIKQLSFLKKKFSINKNKHKKLSTTLYILKGLKNSRKGQSIVQLSVNQLGSNYSGTEVCHCKCDL